jgi:leader peptidase (prepilin peptidase)/N-methyltransferase
MTPTTETAESLTFLKLMVDPTTWWLWAAFVFVLGLLMGSFFNVCIYRLPAGMSVNRPRRSLCFRCGSPVRWYDNVPILSYLLLGGRCRDCGARFSLRYAGVELLTGLLFLAIHAAINPPGAEAFQLATLWYWAFAGLLVIGTFTDIDHWIIPDEVTLGGAAVAMVAAVLIGVFDAMPLLVEYGPFPAMRVYWDSDPLTLFVTTARGASRASIAAAEIHWWEPALNALVGALFGAGLLYSIGVAAKVVMGRDGMGMGDVKLFLLIGATLGLVGTILTLVLACFVGATIGMATIAVGALGRRPAEDLIDAPPAEAPAPDDQLAVAIAALEARHRAAPRVRRVHHLPFGPSIAIAALAVLILHRPLLDLVARNLF